MKISLTMFVLMILASFGAVAGSSVADSNSNSGYAEGDNYSIYAEGVTGVDGQPSTININIGEAASAVKPVEKGEMSDSGITLETPPNDPVPQESEGSFWDGFE